MIVFDCDGFLRSLAWDQHGKCHIILRLKVDPKQRVHPIPLITFDIFTNEYHREDVGGDKRGPMMIPEPLYFGCWQQPGHFLWQVGMRKIYGQYKSFTHRLETKFDGTLCPSDTDVEGLAALHILFSHREDCITALAFWDRSVDKRGGCNSVFFLPGRMFFDEAVKAAREAFPEVFARFNFSVVRDHP